MTVYMPTPGLHITATEPENATVEYSALVPTRERGTQLAVLQLEHAGGQCDAWVVDKIFFSSNFSSLVYSAR